MSLYNKYNGIKGAVKMITHDILRKEKALRLLDIYERLNKGEVINKANLSFEYGVSEKTIQRDFNDLRVFLAETRVVYGDNDLVYDKKVNGYRLLKSEFYYLNKEECISLFELMIKQETLNKKEMKTIMEKLISLTKASDKNELQEWIKDKFK